MDGDLAQAVTLDDGRLRVKVPGWGKDGSIEVVFDPAVLSKTSTARLIATAQKHGGSKDPKESAEALIATMGLFDRVFGEQAETILSELDADGDPDVADTIGFLAAVFEAVGGKNS